MPDIVYPPSRIVETAYGKVEGRRLISEGERKVDAFQGIPFAAPPVGDLRFKKPQQPESWEGVRETKQFAAPQIQYLRAYQDNKDKGVPSEDSLYLNVFTPRWEAPEGGFPVMVFIHWGAFAFGEAISYGDIGICENIVTRGIVVVTIQYRLGYLGFFSTGDAICPGNFGLWDQIEALKWVQLNIGAFGGDKNNVTVAGLSAGSVSVDLLHLSPHSTNLFHKVFCMAGTAECRWAIHPDMVAQSRRKAKRLGVEKFSNDEELLAQLRLLPAENFAVDEDNQDKEDKAHFEVGPCLDGDLFPESIESLRRKATPKPILTGITKDEGLLMMPGRKSTSEGLEETLLEATRDCRRKEEMKAELISRFVGDTKPDGPVYMRAQAGMVADTYFVAGVVELCRKTVQLQTNSIYLYVFEHFNPSVLGKLGEAMAFQGPTHGCEIFYLFKKGLFGNPELSETEKRVMDIYTTACTNFVKYGNPNGSNDSGSDLPRHWKPITIENPALNYVITSDEPKMNNLLFEGRTDAFINIHNMYN
ncbi:hypothetical protein PRIPAC_74856 [Pristionchus pacificus]|uniref:Carboxylic ester hydrolase n=1 Tax=Pristionchus pacificus TaxID=54126 RepID=A0A2A6BEY6_PRIPA|nr:hypothetical protein PRIPAC_74856 [Pristionchus pacificus]|eukprot:PDM64428.1 esterase [Pristionchus pacificus]